jgi:hypothetical protein
MNRYLVKSNTYLPSKRENLPIHRELGLICADQSSTVGPPKDRDLNLYHYKAAGTTAASNRRSPDFLGQAGAVKFIAGIRFSQLLARRLHTPTCEP